MSQLGEGRDCKRKWHDLSQSDTSNTESDTEFEEPELRLEVNIIEILRNLDVLFTVWVLAAKAAHSVVI